MRSMDSKADNIYITCSCLYYLFPMVMDMHTSHLIEAANFGILLSLWDTLRNILRNTESKEKYVYSISVSKIICCGG